MREAEGTRRLSAWLGAGRAQAGRRRLGSVEGRGITPAYRLALVIRLFDVFVLGLLRGGVRQLREHEHTPADLALHLVATPEKADDGKS